MLYSRRRRHAALQVIGDVALLGWLVGCGLVARLVHDVVMSFAVLGRQVDQRSSTVADSLQHSADQASTVPLVGDRLGSALAQAADSVRGVAGLGSDQVHQVENLAFWLTLATAVVPTLFAILLWVPRRVSFAIRASKAQQFIDAQADLDLFALRALTNQPMHRLARISDDPARAWREKDPAVVTALALLELEDVGLRPPRTLTH